MRGLISGGVGAGVCVRPSGSCGLGRGSRPNAGESGRIGGGIRDGIDASCCSSGRATGDR